MDFSVFGRMKGPAKTHVSSFFNNPVSLTATFTIYTAFELIGASYSTAMTAADIKTGFERTGMWPLPPDVSTDATFPISAPYEYKNSTDISNPWEDVAARSCLRAESLAHAGVVTRTGTVSTAAERHVSSTSLLAVIRGRAEAGIKTASDNAEAGAEAVKKKEDRSLAVRQGAVRRAKA